MHAHTTTVLAYRLPRNSEILVSMGQTVKAGDVLAKTFVSKETVSFPLSSIFHADPKKVQWFLIKKPGEEIKKGDLVAFRKGFLGLFSKRFYSSVDGQIDRIDPETGDLYIKLDAKEIRFISDVSGKVVQLSEDLVSVEFQAVELDSESSYKGKKVGKIELIKISHDKDSLNFLNESFDGKVLAIDGEIGRDFLFKSSALGVMALIVSSDQRAVFEGGVFDKIIKVLSKEVVISMPVFAVEGEEGKIKSAIWETLESHLGKPVILDGDSQKILLPV
jgi:hypothetical protein